LTPVTNMRSWRGKDGRTLESARVLLASGNGLRALGRVVWVPAEGTAFTASYRLVVGEEGALSRLAVTTASADRERTLTVNHTEDGYWLLDTGSGGCRAEFQGALDVDVAYSPLFNALPIRRLGLHRQAAERTVPVVYVSLPTLEVELMEQHYRTVVPLGEDGRAVVNFRAGAVDADLVVDADGLVLDYPNLVTAL
jgi:hypothetical protein